MFGRAPRRIVFNHATWSIEYVMRWSALREPQPLIDDAHVTLEPSKSAGLR